MRMPVIFLAGLCIFFLNACKEYENMDEVLESICVEDMDRHLRILASDEFMGRAPGTGREDKTLDYLKNEFIKLGLKPGNNGSYFQEVPLITSLVESGVKFQIFAKNETLSLEYGTDFLMYSPHNEEKISIDNADLVFVGFGIVAPEYNWNDYSGIDVEGKIVFMLTHDPGFYIENTNLFKGEAMTYYGRNSHKFEEAAKRGAKGVIIIHIEEATGYKWNDRGSKPSKKYFLDGNSDSFRCSFEGSISYDKACKVFEMGNLNLQKEINSAINNSYKSKSIALKASVSFENKLQKIHSNNILALWPGKRRPNEYIIFTAHWDHLGIGKSINGDSIYNGAADNAVGLSALLEIAEAFTKLSTKPECSIMFLMPTAEERGLLGSEYYSSKPIVPFEDVLANFNVDGIFPFGKMKDVGVIGHGLSDLDEIILEVATSENRTVSPDENLSQGYFYRLDMFHFAKNGVPTVHMGTGKLPVDSIKTKMLKDTLGSFYHRPWDEYKPELWDMEGMIDDIRFTFKVAHAVSNSETSPQWYNEVEYGKLRSKTQEIVVE